jgi:hypothetical protein
MAYTIHIRKLVFLKILLYSFPSVNQHLPLIFLVINTMPWCSPLKPLGHTTLTHSTQNVEMDAISSNTGRMRSSLRRFGVIRWKCSSSCLEPSTICSCIAPRTTNTNDKDQKITVSNTQSAPFLQLGKAPTSVMGQKIPDRRNEVCLEEKR